MLKMRISAIAVLSLIMVSFTAQAKVGSVVLSIGNNTAQLSEQEVRTLKRKSEIFSQDYISTGEKGQLQLRFSDGSRLALRPDSQFRVEEYRFSELEPANGKSVYRLIKGGLRTITGKISDANLQNYSVNTPIATIGVRGTHYTLFYCDKTCKEATRSKMGLYGYVLEGEVVVGSEAVKAPVQSGRYFFLGEDGSSLKIRKSPFALFEILKDMGPDLMNDTDMGGDIPALDVHTSPNTGGRSPQSPNPPTEIY